MRFKDFYLDESLTPKKPSKVLTKYKIKDSGLWSKHKLRYKEFTTPLGNKVYISFKDYGGYETCMIGFETGEDFTDKELNDPDILKGVLYVVLKEVNNKQYNVIEIDPVHRTGNGHNKHVRFDIFKRLIQKYFTDYKIEWESRQDFGDKDAIMLRRIRK